MLAQAAEIPDPGQRIPLLRRTRDLWTGLGSEQEEEEAPAMILKAGELVERRLEDPALAITYYEKLRELFPDHKLALEALKKIDKAQRRLAREG